MKDIRANTTVNSPWPAGIPQFYLSCAHISVTGGGSASPATISIPGAFKETDPGYTANVSFLSLSFSLCRLPGHSFPRRDKKEEGKRGPEQFYSSLFPTFPPAPSFTGRPGAPVIPNFSFPPPYALFPCLFETDQNNQQIYSNFNSYTVPGPAEFTCSGSGNGGGSGGSTPSNPTTLKTTTVAAPKTSTTAAGSQPTSPSGCSVAKYGQCGGIGYSGCTSCASGSSCKVTNEYYSQCL